MREDGGDGEATGALDVHEEGARGRDESLWVEVSTRFLKCAVKKVVP